VTLDFVVFDRDEQIVAELPIGAELHDSLMRIIQRGSFPLLRQAGDYYRDAEYPVDALPALRDEVALLGQSTSDARIREFVAAIDLLIEAAVSRGRGIAVVAD